MEGLVICLDTNYLIKGIELGSAEAARMAAWYASGEQMIVPMPAWFEFICGPLTSAQEATSRAFLAEITPFDENAAREAARLFNAANRKRHLRVDAMIAGVAIVSGAKLATNNTSDFQVFVPHGLQLV